MNESRNCDRSLVRAVKHICETGQITCNSLSHDWIISLANNGVAAKIYGYQFDINSSAAMQIASDKAALSSVLESDNIPCVKHELFLKPSLSGYLDDNGNWERATKFLMANKSDIVAKPNQGTGGNGVYRIKSKRALEEAFQEIHGSERGLALSPFINIEKEYRLVVLGGECLLVYEKRRPEVTGNGIDTYKTLVNNKLLAGEITEAVYVEAITNPARTLESVIEDSEVISILWRHNLGKGAHPELISDTVLIEKLHVLANNARVCCGLEFASIDIIENDGSHTVLEINSGVMLENLSLYFENGYEMAVTIYKKAMAKMLRQTPIEAAAQ